MSTRASTTTRPSASPRRQRRRDQEGVPQAGQAVPPGLDRRRQGQGDAVQGDLERVRHPRRSGQARASTTPCSGRASPASAAAAAARRRSTSASCSPRCSAAAAARPVLAASATRVQYQVYRRRRRRRRRDPRRLLRRRRRVRRRSRSARRRRRRGRAAPSARAGAPAEQQGARVRRQLADPRGHDVHSDVRLSFDQAVLGTVASVATLDGKRRA